MSSLPCTRPAKKFKIHSGKRRLVSKTPTLHRRINRDPAQSFDQTNSPGQRSSPHTQTGLLAIDLTKAMSQWHFFSQRCQIARATQLPVA